MPSTSKKQRRLMGWAKAYQSGKIKQASAKVKNIAKSMNSKDLGHFAHTKHEGLPEKVAFMTGFAKRAEQLGYSIEQIDTIMKQAGFDKEGFLGPLLGAAIRGGSMIGGSVLGTMATEGLAARAAAGQLPKALQNSFIGKGLAKTVTTAEKAYKPGDTLPMNAGGMFANAVGGTAGSMVAPMIAEPFAQKAENALSNPQDTQYNQQYYGQ